MLDMNCYFANKLKFNDNLIVESCGCLPDCSSINFNLETSKAPYHFFDDEAIMEIKSVYEGTG